MGKGFDVIVRQFVSMLVAGFFGSRALKCAFSGEIENAVLFSLVVAFAIAVRLEKVK